MAPGHGAVATRAQPWQEPEPFLPEQGCGTVPVIPFAMQCKKKKKANKGVLSPSAAACVCAPLSDVAAIGKSQ